MTTALQNREGGERSTSRVQYGLPTSSRSNSILIDYGPEDEIEYYRFYNEGEHGSDMAGDFTFRDQEVVSRHDVDGVSDRFALPNDPDSVATMRVPDDDLPIEMQVSTTANNKWGDGRGTQHIIQREIDDTWFEYSPELTDQLINS